jgi:ribonuclease D
MSITTVNKAIEAANDPVLIESASQMREASQAWKDKPVLGIDTEFVRERTYRANLGLVQVSDGETAWLVDPLAVPSLDPLVSMLDDAGILKVLHSGSEDLEVLLHSVGTLPAPMADTQIACAMLGQPLQLGYHNAANWLLGVELDKDQTRSDWCRRPLQSRQLHYAAMDVLLLPYMLGMLREKLEQNSRWEWLEEDVARMQKLARLDPDPDRIYLRVAGAGRLKEENLRVLRALARWREIRAIRENRARGFVVQDAVLMKLAQEMPNRPDAIRDMDGIHPRFARRHGEELAQLINDARSDTSPIDKIESMDDKQRAQLKRMRNLVQAKSKDLEVDPALLASRKELEKLIRAEAGKEPAPERFMGWRKAVITDDLLDIIR